MDAESATVCVEAVWFSELVVKVSVPVKFPGFADVNPSWTWQSAPGARVVVEVQFPEASVPMENVEEPLSVRPETVSV